MFGALPNRKNVLIPSATNSKIMRQVMCNSIMYRIMTDVFWKSVCKLSRHKEIDLVPEIKRAVFLSPIIVDVVSVSEREDSPTAGCLPLPPHRATADSVTPHSVLFRTPRLLRTQFRTSQYR